MLWYPTSREKRARCGAPGLRQGTRGSPPPRYSVRKWSSPWPQTKAERQIPATSGGVVGSLLGAHFVCIRGVTQANVGLDEQISSSTVTDGSWTCGSSNSTTSANPCPRDALWPTQPMRPGWRGPKEVLFDIVSEPPIAGFEVDLGEQKASVDFPGNRVTAASSAFRAPCKSPSFSSACPSYSAAKASSGCALVRLQDGRPLFDLPGIEFQLS